MSLYKWTRTGYGRTWEIEVEGSGSPDDLLVDKWPRLSFASRPRKKKAGVYPRRLSLPFIDRAGERGYLSERLFNEELTFNLTLDSNLYFKGTSYAENRPKPIEEDEYRTQIIVSDGLDKLDSIRWEFGTYTYTEFLREVFSQINTLDIHLFTDWDEDNSLGDLPDVNRITIGSPDDTYLDVLKKFCTAYGYQVYQDEGVWVVRSLAYYSADSITRWVITPTTVSSSLVSTFANLSTQYKSSEIDMVRGVGQARSTFEWPLLEGGITNPEFSDDEVGWGVVGEPPSAGTLNNSSQSYNQKVGSLIRRGDRLNIDFRVKLNYEALDTSTTVRYAQVIFRNFNGDVYYLQNDGSVTETPTTLDKFVETPPVSGQDLFIDESFSVNTIIGGFPFTFSGACEIKLVFDSDDGNYNSWTYENADASTEIRTARFTRQVSDSSLGSLPISKIELPISQNSTQYSGNEVEFYNGSAWKPSLVFGGRTFGIKRSFDEIRVRNSNIDILRSEGDFGDFLGMSKLYLYDGVRYIAMACDITIGEDDVTLYLFRHEVSTGFTENEFFDNGGEASVSSVGGAPSSGTSSGGGGLDQSTADARYARQSLNGSDFNDIPTVRTNLGLSEDDIPTFNQLDLNSEGTTETSAVRADRRIVASAGLQTIGNDNLTDDISIEMTTPLSVGVDTQNTVTGGSSEVWDLSTEVWDLSTEEFNPDSHTHALDLSGRTLTAGGGLTGLGNLGADRTVDLGTPSQITVSSADSVKGESHTHSLDLSGRELTAGNGLTGLGNLGADRTVNMGTPSTLTVSSSNSTTATSHNHALDLSGRSVDTTGVLSGGGNLGQDRTLSLSFSDPIYNNNGSLDLRISDPLFLDGNSLSVQDHGNGQKGVILPTFQEIHGEKTLLNKTNYHNVVESENFTDVEDFYEGAQLSQDTLKIETIRANELRVKAFVAEISAALYGEDILTKSRGVLSRDFTVPAVGSSATLYVEDLEGFPDTQVFENNDWVRLRIVDRSGGGLLVADAWGKVTNYQNTVAGDGEQSWTFTTEKGTTGDTIFTGSIAIDYGQSGDGVIVRSVIGENTPRDTTLTWVNDPSVASNYTLLTRTGNLNGSFGITTDRYGFGAKDNVIIEVGDTDTMTLGKDAGGAGLHGIHINDDNRWYGNGQLQVGGANGITHFPSQTWDSSDEVWDSSEMYFGAPINLGSDVYIDGNAQIAGDAVVDGSLTLNKINFTPLTSAGGTGDIIATINSTTEGGLRIDGSNLDINAQTTFQDDVEIKGTLDGVKGVFTGALEGGTIKIGSSDNVFKADSNGIYLGNDVFSSAPFRVTQAGELTATSGSFGGELDAVTGSFGDVEIGGTLTNPNNDYEVSSTGFKMFGKISTLPPQPSASLIFENNENADEIARIGSTAIIGGVGEDSLSINSYSNPLRLNASNISVGDTPIRGSSDGLFLQFGSPSDTIKFEEAEATGSTSTTENGFIVVRVNGTKRRIKTFGL